VDDNSLHCAGLFDYILDTTLLNTPTVRSWEVYYFVKHPNPPSISPDTKRPQLLLTEVSFESGGDGGGSNSPSRAYHLPGLLLSLLDQLTTMGETAAQIKKAFKDGILRDYDAVSIPGGESSGWSLPETT